MYPLHACSFIPSPPGHPTKCVIKSLTSTRCTHPTPKYKLQAFDEHVNMVLGDCEETHTSEETDGETGEVSLKSTTRQLGLIFVRGDIVVFVSPR